MSWIIRTLSTWQGRLLSGLAAMTAVGVASASMASPSLPIAAKIGIAIPLLPTLAAWVAATISGGNASHPHDVRLFECIVGLVSANERNFLRTHDFANNFSLSSLGGMREICHWQGAPYRFLDADLQQRWTILKTSIDELCELIALTTAPQKGNVHFHTVYPRLVDPEDPPPKVILEIKALNDAASVVSEGLDGFEPFARCKLFV